MTSTSAFAAKSTTLDLNATAAFAPMGVFQSLEFETNATTGLGNWIKAKRKLAAERSRYEACDNASITCPPQLREWRNKLHQWQSLSQKAKLIQVNRFGNAAIAYTEDRNALRSDDNWATPIESLKGRGDCEDYVLLKYASLNALGFAEDQLRIVIVNDLKAGIGHAVLSVKTASGIYILDNQDNRVLRHDSIKRYAPVYSVNAKGRWINTATRDLKKRRSDPVALVANESELGDVLPVASAPPKAAAVAPLPVLKKARINPTMTELPKPRLQAVAASALLRQPVSAAERKLKDVPATPAQNTLERWTSLVSPLLDKLLRWNTA